MGQWYPDLVIPTPEFDNPIIEILRVFEDRMNLLDSCRQARKRSQYEW